MFYFRLLQIVSWICAIISVFILIASVTFFYKGHPDLIGANYVPVDFYSTEILILYKELFVAGITLIGSIGIILIKKWGWYTLQVSMLLGLFEIINVLLDTRAYTSDILLLIAIVILNTAIIWLHYIAFVKAKFCVARKSNLRVLIWLSLIAIMFSAYI